MSQLSDFAKAAFSRARTITGGQSLSIGGGTSVSVTVGTRSDRRDFESGGYESDVEVEVTAAKAEFESAYASATRTYLGKTATLDGRTFRVESIQYRDPLYVISMISSDRGA